MEHGGEEVRQRSGVEEGATEDTAWVPDPVDDFPHGRRERKRSHGWGRSLRALLMAGVLGLIGYSVYVAQLTPDPQETILMTQRRWDVGAPVSPRIVVRNRLDGTPLAQARVSMSLLGEDSEWLVGEGVTGDEGTVGLSWMPPAEAQPGTYRLEAEVQSPLGEDHLQCQVELVRDVRIHLHCDKPAYQPGQTMHLRAYAAGDAGNRPLGEMPLVFEVRDGRDNLVFRERCRTSEFGLASVDVDLADEVNCGSYPLRVAAENGEAEASKTVKVARYTLPPFGVELSTGKSYYLPGQTVRGTIRAEYFFGRAVSGGRVTVRPRLTAGAVPTVLEGSCDDEGTFRFEFELPDRVKAPDDETGTEDLEIRASVTDAGGRTVSELLSLSVAPQALSIDIIPEGGALVPGVENRVYVVARRPDGAPARCTVRTGTVSRQTDGAGVAVFKKVPSVERPSVSFRATDVRGATASGTVSVDEEGAPPLLLRVNPIVCGVEDRPRVFVRCAETPGDRAVYLDVLHEGKTRATHVVPMLGRQGILRFALPKRVAGIIELRAYVLGEHGEHEGMSRRLYIRRDSAVRIDAELDAETYRPGETATLRLAAHTPDGQPVRGAFGVSVVDEKVFELHGGPSNLVQELAMREEGVLGAAAGERQPLPPGGFVRLAAEHPDLATALLVNREVASARIGLWELVDRGYLPRHLAELLEWDSDPGLRNKLRADPRWSDVMEMLERGGATYDVRMRTGPIKERRTRAFRRRYFERLWTMLRAALAVTVLGGVCLSIFGMARRSKEGKEMPDAIPEEDRELYAAAARNSQLLPRLLAVQLLIHFGGYVLAVVGLFGRLGGNGTLVLIFTIEALAVVWLTSRLIGRHRSTLKRTGISEHGTLIYGPALYLAQHVVTRLPFLVPLLPRGVQRALDIRMEWVLPFVLIALCAPLAVLGYSSYMSRRALRRRGLDPGEQRDSDHLLAILVLIACVAILAGMLLPALGQAREKARGLARMSELKQVEAAMKMAEADGLSAGGEGTPSKVADAAHVRRHFPETLLWEPEVIMDADGRATVSIPVADSITNWRATVDAVSATGAVGATEVPIPVFQEFFVEPDLPPQISLGDVISLPVVCHNYLDGPQSVRVAVRGAEWFAPLGGNTVRTVDMAAGSVKTVHFPIRVLQVGDHTLRIDADSAAARDAVERPVRVVPTGRRHTRTASGHPGKEGGVALSFAVPADSVPGASGLRVRLYPSVLSEVVDGLNSVFRRPHGCFEQTSAATYPNVLVLRYLRRTGQARPELEKRARDFIGSGHQRLLTFQVDDTGFEWYGRSPANVELTAYAILQFTDMQRVHDVEPTVLPEARAWLAKQQNADGSWSARRGCYTWAGRCSSTAFVAWCLAESGDRSPLLQRAVDYLVEHPGEIETTYSKALAANALLAVNPRHPTGVELLIQLRDSARPDGEGGVHWDSEGSSVTHSRGGGLKVECTALAAMAFMKAGTDAQMTRRALAWISSRKSPDGGWRTTQSTILAMKALLAGETSTGRADVDSQMVVDVNGTRVHELAISAENSDLMRQVSLGEHLRTGRNHVVVRQKPETGMTCQIVGEYWMPRDGAAKPTKRTPSLRIKQRCRPLRLQPNERLTCEVRVGNDGGTPLPMVVVELTVPPGFAADPSAFDRLVAEGRIARYERNEPKIVLYLRQLEPDEPLKFSYELRPSHPLRVTAQPAVAYEYYTPENRAESEPQTVEVKNAN